MGGINRALTDPLPLRYRYDIVWGSLYTVIPVALALSLPERMPFYEERRTMVFGVAILSVRVQGLLMLAVLKLTGISEQESFVTHLVVTACLCAEIRSQNEDETTMPSVYGSQPIGGTKGKVRMGQRSNGHSLSVSSAGPWLSSLSAAWTVR